MLWHNDRPAGICIFAPPAASLKLRSRHFGLTGARGRVAMQALNQQLWLLSRVVLHPTYRGAGVAAAFVRRACELCPVDWVETLAAMGRVNPFFERAGFTRVGVIRKRGTPTAGNGAYTVRTQAGDRGRHSEPAYYVFDNRGRAGYNAPDPP